MTSGSALVVVVVAAVWSVVLDLPAEPEQAFDTPLLCCLLGVRRRQVAPELQLFVSQLPSSSLELPVTLRRLGLELRSFGFIGIEVSKLSRDRRFNTEIEPLRVGKEPLRLGRDP